MFVREKNSSEFENKQRYYSRPRLPRMEKVKRMMKMMLLMVHFIHLTVHSNQILCNRMNVGAGAT